MMCGYYLLSNRKNYLNVIILFVSIVCLLFSVNKTFVIYPNSFSNKQTIIDIAEELESEDLSYGYTNCMLVDKQLDLCTNEKIYTVMTVYNETQHKFEINKTRCFSYDLKKPEGVNRLFVICSETNDENIADNYEEKIFIGNFTYPDLCIYIFDIAKWDTIIFA